VSMFPRLRACGTRAAGQPMPPARDPGGWSWPRVPQGQKAGCGCSPGCPGDDRAAPGCPGAGMSRSRVPRGQNRAGPGCPRAAILAWRLVPLRSVSLAGKPGRRCLSPPATRPATRQAGARQKSGGPGSWPARAT
jgi:hypothetical protein